LSQARANAGLMPRRLVSVLLLAGGGRRHVALETGGAPDALRHIGAVFAVERPLGARAGNGACAHGAGAGAGPIHGAPRTNSKCQKGRENRQHPHDDLQLQLNVLRMRVWKREAGYASSGSRDVGTVMQPRNDKAHRWAGLFLGLGGDGGSHSITQRRANSHQNGPKTQSGRGLQASRRHKAHHQKTTKNKQKGG